LPTRHVYTLEPGHPTPGRLNLLRPPIASLVGTGILTRFPSTTALALVLGADSPCADERGAGNLGLSASRPFTCFIATHVSIRTSDTSSKGHPSPSQAYGTLSYHPQAPQSALSPRNVSVAQAVLTLMDALPLQRFAPQRQAPCASALSGACRSAISVPSLSPVTSSAQDDSTSELLRFL
jgi:hypothetical protein